jgi:hypothetical protein
LSPWRRKDSPQLATNGIDKPVLNAFRMFGMLGAGKSGAQ